jgi:hypothetical protein
LDNKDLQRFDQNWQFLQAYGGDVDYDQDWLYPNYLNGEFVFTEEDGPPASFTTLQFTTLELAYLMGGQFDWKIATLHSVEVTVTAARTLFVSRDPKNFRSQTAGAGYAVFGLWGLAAAKNAADKVGAHRASRQVCLAGHVMHNWALIGFRPRRGMRKPALVQWSIDDESTSNERKMYVRIPVDKQADPEGISKAIAERTIRLLVKNMDLFNPQVRALIESAEAGWPRLLNADAETKYWDTAIVHSLLPNRTFLGRTT